MNTITVITVDSPDRAPRTLTFVPRSPETEHIDINTYSFSPYNTDDPSLAAQNLATWLNLSITHPNPDVRDWFSRFCRDILARHGAGNDFDIPAGFGVLTMWRQNTPLGPGPWQSDPHLARTCLDMLAWAQSERLGQAVDAYAGHALRCLAVATFGQRVRTLVLNWDGSPHLAIIAALDTHAQQIHLDHEHIPTVWAEHAQASAAAITRPTAAGLHTVTGLYHLSVTTPHPDDTGPGQ